MAGTATARVADFSEQRRTKILDKALRIFLAHGYEKASLEDIANAASVSKITIYDYFGDKSGLVAAVLQSVVLRITRACKQKLDPDAPIEATLIQFAERFIGCMMESVGGRPHYESTRLLLEVSYHQPAAARKYYDAMASELDVPMRAYLQSQIDRGRLAAGDPEFLAAHLFHSIFDIVPATFAVATGSPYAHTPTVPEVAEIARYRVKIFLRGCAS